ncbi:MAG: putative Zn finger protein [Glaciecola sp.]|jgi:uncharacterized Zn finger protein
MPDSTPILHLQKLAGRRTFDKGEMLYFQEAVHRFSKDGMIISAIVQEIQEFNVQLSIIDDQYEGSCNCTDSEGFDFCKHCVAVALTDIARETDLKNLQEGDEVQRITAYIESMSESEVKSTLLKQVTADIDIAEQWVLFADVTNGKINKKVFVDLINKALPLREVWRQNRVKTYFESAIEKFNRLISVLNKLPPETAFELTQTALLRYNKALGKIKDDKGYRLKVEVALLQMLATSFRQLVWGDERKVAFLLSLYKQPFPNFPLPSIYKRFVKNEPDLKPLFLQKLMAHEAKFEQDKTSHLNLDIELTDNHRFVLEDLALYCTEEIELPNSNKIDSNTKSGTSRKSNTNETIGHLIQYQDKLANSLNDYIDLAELCIEHGRKDDAKAYISEMESLELNYRQESKVLTLNAKLQESGEDIDAALDLHWRAYTRSFNAKDFLAILDLLQQSSEKTEQDTQYWFEKARTLLQEQLNDDDDDDEDPLFELYLACDQFEVAVDEALEASISSKLLHQIAVIGLEQQPELGFALYRRLIRLYPKNTNTQGYETAIELLVELKAALKTKKQHQAFEFLISELSFDFKQKRKFIVLLQSNFGL